MGDMTTTPTIDRTAAVANDTTEAAALAARSAAEQTQHRATDTIRRATGQSKDRNGKWSGSIRAANDIANVQPWSRTSWTDAIAAIASAQTAIDTANTTIEECEKAWYTGGMWSRFFLVTSSDGHIHSSLSCHTCHDTTTYAWLPDLSGLTMADAVAEHGEILCSVCFPDAPVAWTNGESKATIAAKAARTAEKAARDAKRLAKLLRTDGTVLRVGRSGYSERIETIAAAKAYLTDAHDYPAQFPAVTEVATELAERIGSTVEAELAAAAKRHRNRR